jgi:hypothetical protein
LAKEGANNHLNPVVFSTLFILLLSLFFQSCVYEAYGPEKAGLLLNALGRLFTAFIQYYSGHSCRMEDLILTKEADASRRELIQVSFLYEYNRT